MKRLFFLFLLAFLLTSSSDVLAQRTIKDSTLFMPLVSLSYAGQIPGGDVAERFGPNSSLGFHALFKTKSNFVFGLEANFLFSKNVKELTVLDPLRTADGNIITTDGEYAFINAYQRGWVGMASVGKIFPWFGPNPNSGVMLKASIGYMQHKIRYDVDMNNVPQLVDPYVKGYDRLTGGLATSQFIGYQYLGNKRFYNFFAGFEFYQGFTKSLRSWDFDLISADTEQKLDLFYSLRVGWTAPIYKRAPKEFYTY